MSHYFDDWKPAKVIEFLQRYEGSLRFESDGPIHKLTMSVRDHHIRRTWTDAEAEHWLGGSITERELAIAAYELDQVIGS